MTTATKHLCDEPGCTEEGLTVYFAPGEEAGHFCAAHCHKHGFCWGCLYFWAGVEVFDFNPNGLCHECQMALEDDFAEEAGDESDGWYPGWEDMP